MRRLFLATMAVTAGLVVSGCEPTYTVDNVAGVGGAPLERGAGVYVAVPQDGAYGSRVYQGSGQTVAQSVAAALSPYASSVHVAERVTDTPTAMAAARAVNARYVAVPIIAQWEHRATAWSGLPSRMSVRVTIYDAASGAQLRSNVVEGRSEIMTMTGTSPDALLRTPMATWAAAAYGATPPSVAK